MIGKNAQASLNLGQLRRELAGKHYLHRDLVNNHSGTSTTPAERQKIDKPLMKEVMH